MNKAILVTTLCVLVGYACSGTETQNPGSPLKSFNGSACKKELKKSTAGATGETATAAQALVSTDYGAEIHGLKCIAWERVGTSGLNVDLYNFEGACGAQWAGKATIESDGALGLSLVNPQCLIASCGWCIYDWSFELEGVDMSRPLSVGVGIDTCPGERSIEKLPATIPVDVIPSGILCNYANVNALGWQAMALSECGTVGMPCSGTSMCSTTPASAELSCQGDLVCADNGNAAERICVKPCTEDENCGSLGVQSCQNGLCRPKSNW